MEFSFYTKLNFYKVIFLFLGFFLLVTGIGYFFSYLLGGIHILYLAIIFSTAMTFFSFWFSDKVVLAVTKAQPLDEKSQPEIYQITKNLCQRANLPLPKIYLIREKQPNAFATGRNEKQAKIAVTEGLLEKLNKEEIEGVIGHELSHIKNKDMLLMTVIVILVGFVAILSRMFLWSSLFGNRRDSAGGILVLVGLVMAILAPLSVMLIQLAISRKREFLADAHSAYLTKNPEGLARALEKIARDKTPLRVAQEATCHLYIHNPFKDQNFIKWFSTHPPVEERVKALRALKI